MVHVIQTIEQTKESPVLPTKTSGCGSGGCSSGGCGSQSEKISQTEEIHTDISFNQRNLKLNATPTNGTFITSIDMDLTVACNLRCTYCFKEKWEEHMEDDVAFDTLIWLLHASGPHKEVHVNFMGGEPLMRFKLIQRIVPFGRQRAWQMGKNMTFGMTTNGTLVTDKVVEFWRKWGMGFHTSIDGTPKVQDVNRPTINGKGSSKAVERAVPKILEARPNTCARSTVVPASAGALEESFHYFKKLGYRNMAFVTGGPSLWNKESNAIFEEQCSKLGDLVIEEYRQGNSISMYGFDAMIEGIVRKSRPIHSCGAGRGMALIDIHGDIWPCHRWNKESEKVWRMGNIYEEFNELARKELDVRSQVAELEQDCGKCVANLFCGGGCPAENLEETGRVYKRHPNACEHTRTYARVGRHIYDTLLAEKNETFIKRFINQEIANAA